MSEKMDKLLEIANKHLRLTTLEEQKIDSLDFKEFPIWEIKKALEKAYEAGEAKIKLCFNIIENAEQFLSDDKIFQSCIVSITDYLDIEDIDLANKMAVSRSTVLRWKNGKAVPHPLMRKPVYKILKRYLLK